MYKKYKLKIDDFFLISKNTNLFVNKQKAITNTMKFSNLFIV